MRRPCALARAVVNLRKTQRALIKRSQQLQREHAAYMVQLEAEIAELEADPTGIKNGDGPAPGLR